MRMRIDFTEIEVHTIWQMVENNNTSLLLKTIENIGLPFVYTANHKRFLQELLVAAAMKSQTDYLDERIAAKIITASSLNIDIFRLMNYVKFMSGIQDAYSTDMIPREILGPLSRSEMDPLAGISIITLDNTSLKNLIAFLLSKDSIHGIYSHPIICGLYNHAIIPRNMLFAAMAAYLKDAVD